MPTPPPLADPTWATGLGSGPPTGTVDRELGYFVLYLLQHPDEWIHRRVESIDFVDDITVRRRVSVDFQLPDRNPSAGAPTPLFIPLTLLQKKPLVGFDLRDENGDTLPLLTHTQSDWLGWSALVVAVEMVLDPTPLPDPIVGELWEIVHSEAPAATALLPRIFDANRAPGPLRAQLKANTILVNRTRSLAESFILFVPIFVGKWRRRVVKFSYIEELESDKKRFDWRSTVLDIDVPAVDHTGSYHVETQAPDGIEIVGARLRIQNQFGITDIGQAEPRARVHLYTPSVGPGSNAVLRLGFQTIFTRLPMAALFSTLLTAAVLTMAVLFAGRLDANSGSDPVAIFLAIPSVIALLVARPPGEHDLLSRRLFALRVIVVASGVLPFVAAGVFVLHIARSALGVMWWTLAGFGWLIFVVVLAQGATRAQRARVRSLWQRFT